MQPEHAVNSTNILILYMFYYLILYDIFIIYCIRLFKENNCDKTCRCKGLLVFIYFAMFGIYTYGLVGCLLAYLNAVGLRI